MSNTSGPGKLANPILTAVGVLLVLLTAGQASAQFTWNLGADFSIASNPNGDWSYGSMPYAAGVPNSSLFTLYATANADIPLAVGAGPSTIEGVYNAFVDPNVTHNYGDSDYSNFGITWSPGEVSLGPGFNTTNADAASSVRWTAPATGLYDVFAEFQDNQINGAGADVYVYVNGAPVYTADAGNVPESGPPAFFTFLPVFLNAGESIDFIVGSLQGPNNTELAASISQVPLPPETIWAFDRSGDWNAAANWFPGVAPNSNTANVVFGTATTSAATVFTNTDVTAKLITFDNPNMYVIAGAGSVNLQADAGNASLNVVQGSHQFQANVNLLSDTSSNIAAGATLAFNNQLDLGGKTLTKTGDGTIKINNVLNTGGGSIVVLGGALGGAGSIAGNLTNTSGTVAPGSSAGKLTVQGSFSQSPSGTLAVELGGAADGQFDVLRVDQSATLDGTLAVSLVNGFQPQTGDFFSVVATGSGALGAFSSITGSDLGALSAGFKLNKITDSLSVGLLAALPGDADLNKSTDFTDLGILLNNYNQNAGSGVAEWGKGDFDDNHIVDFTDLGILLNNYNQSVTLSAGAAPVPEPSTMVLALLGAAGLIAAGRRRVRHFV